MENFCAAIKRKPIADFLVLGIVFLRFFDLMNLFVGVKLAYILYYLLVAIFGFYVMVTDWRMFKQFVLLSLPLIIVAISTLIRSMIAGQSGIGFAQPLMNFVQLINTLIPILVIFYVLRRPRNFKLSIFITFSISILSNILYSFYYVSFVDYLSIREAAAVSQGVGDFNLIYACIFIPSFSIIFLKNNIKIYKDSSIKLLIYLNT